MKNLLTYIILLILAVGCGISIDKELTLDEQLKTFQELGFVFNEGASKEDIKKWSDEFDFLNPPYALLYQTMGLDIEREPWTPITNKCWDFDTEAINDHGDYVSIIKNMERITRGEIDYENIEDYVDLENDTAWISFTIKGDKYSWDLVVDGDWVDPNLFTYLVEASNNYDFNGQYTVFSTGGQDVVFGYETPNELKRINDKTGLNIEWL